MFSTTDHINVILLAGACVLMSQRNRILPYNPKLRSLARALRKNGPLAEVLLWRALRGKALGCEFHRQVPLDRYIVDFFCHERMLAIEIDGSSHDEPEAYERDKEKDSRLSGLGVRMLRFRDVRVLKDLAGVVNAIREFMEDGDVDTES